ncbi:MAG: hypothetical protein HON90_04625 [Halobacteriovoraceae bacterium]|jgi:hypothetical protein|nr:hypothetical protein [Halobacteriovoraceae bacterium]
MKIIIGFVLFLMATQLMAKEITVATVKSNIDTDIIQIIVETEAQNELKTLYTDTYKKGVFFERKAHDLTNISDGFVLYNKEGRDVVTLKSRDFATYAGGTVEIRYLYNGISGTYRSKSFIIEQEQDSWHISDIQGNIFTNFFFKAKRVWRKIVGVKDIVFTP